MLDAFFKKWKTRNTTSFVIHHDDVDGDGDEDEGEAQIESNVRNKNGPWNYGERPRRECYEINQIEKRQVAVSTRPLESITFDHYDDHHHLESKNDRH